MGINRCVRHWTAQLLQGAKAAITVGVLAWSLCDWSWAQGPPPEYQLDRSMLVLTSTGYGRQGTMEWTAAVTQEWQRQGQSVENLFIEYLDLVRNPGLGHRIYLGELLRQRYTGRPFDLVLVLQPQALDFFFQELGHLAPSAPLLVSSATLSPEQVQFAQRPLLQHVRSLDYVRTLDTAFRIFPKTHHVLVITGSGRADVDANQELLQALPRWRDRARFEFTTGWRYSDIRQKLATLGPGSLVLRTHFQQDVGGRVFSPEEVASEFAQVTTAPTFAVYGSTFGAAPAVGGYVNDFELDGRSLVEVGMDVIRGTRRLSVPVEYETTLSFPKFDWAEVRRWQGNVAAIPSDAEVLNRPRTVWHEYRTEVLWALGALLALSSLVVALVIQNRRRWQAEQRARESEASLKLMVEHAPEAIILFDAEKNQIIDANGSAEALFGLPRDRIIHTDPVSYFMPTQPDGLPAEQSIRRHIQKAEGGEPVVVEHWVRHQRGEERLCELHVLYLLQEVRRLYRLGFVDITDRRKAEARAHQLAFYDGLTGLPNRRLLVDRLAMLLNQVQRTGEYGCVLYMDLDNFKNINDARGLAVGDAMLQAVAQRLKSALHQDDTLARIGGDEFVVLMGGLGTQPVEVAGVAMGLAETLRQSLLEPMEVGGHTCVMAGSIGVTLVTPHACDPDDLLREADTAMFRAKEAGRNRTALYETYMQTRVQERLELEQDLKQALRSEQLRAFVQSQHSHDGRLAGAEMLIRWQHPTRGMVPPVQFIPLAESNDLIIDIGDWMLGQACQTLRQLAAAGVTVPVSVNVSPRQFQQANFVSRIQTLLAQSSVAADRLVLEVTESVLVENMEFTLARMQELAQVGVKFSIDDFGTGYSSLAYLKRMPLYELKIDQGFVQSLPQDERNAGIVRSILSMAEFFALHVVAEGVETQAQADFLQQHGCTTFQGYWYGKPMHVPDWLAQVVGGDAATPGPAASTP